MYGNADLLYDADPDGLIQYLFHQYYVFLHGSHETPALYELFQGEAYRMLSLRGITGEQVEYRLRTKDFANFVEHIFSTVKNEARPSNAGLADGEEETHVCA